MINIWISIVYFLGGLKVLFESRKKYNIYLAVGFILYGVYFLLKPFTLDSAIVQIMFSLPQLLGSFCIMLSPIIYLKGGVK